MPFDMPVLYRDDDIVVVDKPHFLATMPRGRHVAQTATVRLRRELDLPELSPAHRLDRLTAGVLLFTARREVRGAYQTLVRARNGAQDVSGAGRGRSVAGVSGGAAEPDRQAARAVTGGRGTGRGRMPRHWWSIVGDGLYRLTPRTGRTHQLRVHMASLGLSITGDPLYPNVIDVAPDDFSQPLQLLAHSLEFEDPASAGVDGSSSRDARCDALTQPFSGGASQGVDDFVDHVGLW